jgi:hypothetical protein
MSGIVGLISKAGCKEFLFYRTDYHSLLRIEYGGISIFYGKKILKGSRPT